MPLILTGVLFVFQFVHSTLLDHVRLDFTMPSVSPNDFSVGLGTISNVNDFKFIVKRKLHPALFRRTFRHIEKQFQNDII